MRTDFTDETQLNERVLELTTTIKSLRDRLDSSTLSADELVAIKSAVDENKATLAALLEEKAERETAAASAKMRADMDEILASVRPSKAGAIFGGDRHADDATSGGHFLQTLMRARKSGDPDAWAELRSMKATVASSDTTGAYMLPNNLVAPIVEIAKAKNLWRTLLNVVDGVRAGIEIPYEIDDSSLLRAIGQGGETRSYGSNKDTRDFTVGMAAVNLFPLARIIDVGNQFLRQSEGAAEALVRSKLGRAFGLAEAYYIYSGLGTNNQPNGFLTSLAAASATYATALNSESRAAAIGRGISALEARAYTADAVVMHPTDWWELAVETLGASGSGGWALAPALGPANTVSAFQSIPLWGIPAYKDLNATVGSALIGEFSSMDLYFGDGYRIDVSSEAGTRFDLNITGFRAEEEIGFNADPYVLTGQVQKVTGL